MAPRCSASDPRRSTSPRRRPALQGYAATLVAVAASAFATAGASPARAASPPVATTSSGRLVGVADATTDRYLGVRYAVAGRWQLPQTPAKSNATVDATKPGPACAQAAALPGSDETASKTEDCLFLNVTVPAGTKRGDDLPVMVWWHGGGFQSGSGAIYDAQRLASRGHVAVVTVNYRLGIFGYLGLPGLRGGGDFGFADQIAATRWAKRNSRAFGGDPDRLTVFGQSAGAMSACALLTAPAARGLVDRVAMSSGSCDLDWPAGTQFPGVPAARPYVSRHDSETLGTQIAAELGCIGDTTIACMRGKPIESLLAQSEDFGDALAFGTGLLPTDPRLALRHGDMVRVPVLSGGARDEERAFQGGAALADPGFYTDVAYGGLLSTAYGRNADRVDHAYPLARYGTTLLAFSTAATDGSWACPTLRGNRDIARAGGPTYAFEFADRHAPDVNGVGTDVFAPGAAHASDVPYLFDLAGLDLVTTPARRRLADAMIRAWSSFARNGRPSGAGDVWPRFTAGGSTVRQLAPGALTDVDASARHHCALWSSIS